MSTLKPRTSPWNRDRVEMLLRVLLVFVAAVSTEAVPVAAAACPTDAGCKCRDSTVDCSNMDLVRLPANLPPGTRLLNLKGNAIVRLDPDAFGGLRNLRELNLADNALTSVPVFTSKNALLEKLTLSGNRIGAISAASIKHLPRLTFLDLKENVIEELLVDSFPRNNSLVVLQLSRNRIQTVTDGSLQHLSSLEQLRLARNGLTAWNVTAAVPLTNLKMLDLSNNELTFIKYPMFYGFHKLRVINLRKNKIKSVEDGGFFSQKAQHIKEVHLGQNLITEITDGAFLFGLESALSLNISHNLINTISVSVFKHMKYLRNLDLSSNKITSIREDMFVGLGNVTTLSVSHNEIDTIAGEPFHPMSRLVQLDLSHNRITWSVHITSAFFVGAKNLTSLNLSYNRIDAIHKETFHGLDNLRTLDLRRNPISAIQENAFEYLAHLKDIYLISSHFRCDCHLAWFPSWIARRRFDASVNGLCGRGLHVGIGIMNLTRDDFTCDGFPVITSHPASTNAIVNESTTLTCEATSDADDPIHFKWAKGDTIITLFSHPGIVALSNGTIAHLVILETDVKDEGNYTCIAENSYGRVTSYPAKVTANVFPYFTLKPVDGVVGKYGTFKMECQAAGLPRPSISYQFFNNHSTRHKMRVMMDIGVVIKDATQADEGVMACIASNRVGTISVNMTLTVLDKDVRSSLDYDVPSGKSLILNCNLPNAGPRTWYKDNTLVTNSRRRRLTEEAHWLVFEEVQPSDSGSYECHIDEKTRIVVQRFRLTVDPSDGPGPTSGNGIPTESQDGALTVWIAVSLVCGVVFATALWTILFVAVRWRRKRRSRRVARQRKAEQGKAVATQRSRAANGTFAAVRAPTPDADGGSSGSGRLPVRVYVTNGVTPTVEPSSSSGTTTTVSNGRPTNGHAAASNHISVLPRPPLPPPPAVPPAPFQNGKGDGVLGKSEGGIIPMVVIGADGTFRAVPVKKKRAASLDSDSDVD